MLMVSTGTGDAGSTELFLLQELILNCIGGLSPPSPLLSLMVSDAKVN